MKFLVATSRLQGRRFNDYNYCRDGEFVFFGGEHTDEPVDNCSCGCRRSFCGFETHQGTTTVMVVNTSLSEDDFLQKLIKSTKAKGIHEFMGDEACRVEVLEIARIADIFNVGDILEKRGDKIKYRG